MSQYLPYGEFEWVKNVNNFDVTSVSKNSLYGVRLLQNVAEKYSIKVANVKEIVPNVGKKN